MAKRRLNKQQQFRIRKVQEERASRLARKEQKVQAQADAGELGPEQEGLIIAHTTGSNWMLRPWKASGPVRLSDALSGPIWTAW